MADLSSLFSQNTDCKLVGAEIKKCTACYSLDPNKYLNYLQKSPSETKKEYKRRKELPLLGFHYHRGINAIADMVFKKKLKYAKDIKQDWINSVDKINNFGEFAKQLFRQSIVKNDVFVLVYTPVFDKDKVTPEQAKKDGIRPYCKIIESDKVLKDKTLYHEDGSVKMILIEDEVLSEVDEYRQESKKIYKAYFSDGRIHTFTLVSGKYKITKEEHDLEEMHILHYKHDDDLSVPPFISEATLQLKLMNYESLLEAYTWKELQPLMITYGMESILSNKELQEKTPCSESDNPEDCIYHLDIHASRGINFPVDEEDGTKYGGVEYLELAHNGAKNANERIEKGELQIAKGFIRLVVSGSGNKTVAQSEHEGAEGLSRLESVANRFEHFVNDIYKLMLKMDGEEIKDNEEYILLSKEYLSKDLSKLVYDILVDLELKGSILNTDLITELKSYGLLKTIDIEKLEANRISKGLS